MNTYWSGHLTGGILFIVLFLGVFGFAFAHGTGASLEKQVGEYLIDVGYNTAVFAEQSSTAFDFDIKKGDEAVAFSDVWVRISQGTKTVFAGGIYNADFGGARMTYVFPQAGEYEFSVRFENEDESIAESEFQIVVEEKQKEGLDPRVIPTAIALLIGAMAGYSVIYLKKSRA